MQKGDEQACAHLSPLLRDRDFYLSLFHKATTKSTPIFLAPASHLWLYIAKLAARRSYRLALVIYTKPGCPYCQQARDYYNSKGISFIDRDAQTNREFRAGMFKFSGGDPTVPCIVEDGKYIQSGWGDPLRG